MDQLDYLYRILPLADIHLDEHQGPYLYKDFHLVVPVAEVVILHTLHPLQGHKVLFLLVVLYCKHVWVKLRIITEIYILIYAIER